MFAFVVTSVALDFQVGISQMPAKCRRIQGEGRHFFADLDNLLRRQCRMPMLSANLIYLRSSIL